MVRDTSTHVPEWEVFWSESCMYVHVYGHVHVCACVWSCICVLDTTRKVICEKIVAPGLIR